MNCPHSRLSDGCSVGKTIEAVIDEKLDTPNAKDVLNVAKLLQCRVVRERLSLEEAAAKLSSWKGSISTGRVKRSLEDMQTETIMENETV
jgi:hypothetical protein